MHSGIFYFDMLIREKTGTLHTIKVSNRSIDWLPLQWYETNKRILRRNTASGKDIMLKLSSSLSQDDILYEDDHAIIAVDILSCDVLVITPITLFEMASVCYEIGNKHLPLYFENDTLLVPFEMPLYRLLQAQGYNVRQDNKKLLHPLKTTVSPHGQSSLFSKIMQLK